MPWTAPAELTMERPLANGVERPASALARSLLATAILVLAGFALTLGYGYWALTPVELGAAAVMLNALPSARHLTVARTALRDLEEATRPMLRPEGAGPRIAKDAQAARDRLEAAVSAELGTPDFAGESDLAHEMVRALETLDGRTAELLASTTAPNEVRVARTRDWLEAARLADDAIARVARFNIDQGELEARTIVGVQKRAQAIALAMFAGTLLLATIATALTLRLLRQMEREAAIHERFLRDRADDLEAFAGRVAHDLKDPLGTLSLRLGLVRARLGGDPSALGGAIDKAAQQIERMDSVIVSLLDFARAGGQPDPGARAELHDVVDQVVEDLAPAAAIANVELRVDPFPPEELACAPGALSSVLHNLVGNALKYVVDGRDPARLVLLHVAEHSLAVRVEVRDNGPGLPPGTEQAVFEPFVRAGRTRGSGTGLGLSIVRRIVEAHGGRVGVHSEPGAGSCFWFEIPKAHAGA
jgi:signal transduction histidine kinase